MKRPLMLNFLFFCLILVQEAFSQSLQEYIILTDQNFKQDLNKNLVSRARDRYTIEPISKEQGIYQLKFATSLAPEEIRVLLSNTAGIVMFQPNKRLELRKKPNDPLFPNQIQYSNPSIPNADFNISTAWDITTGGITALGDTIVVCVIDDGTSLHEDLSDNLWTNRLEIPNDKIDNDGNGYIDDYLGYNFKLKNDQIFTNNSHGNAIAGIVGAKGNNNLGVSGVNWNVKIMVIEMGDITEASALSAYAYVLKMRKMYNESKGTKGAYIVATNSSWGIERGQPEDSPIWCAMYDSLGQEGILNCTATANSNINVDVEGDLPTGCESNFVVAVTNLNRQNVKPTSAGYGRQSIDLGAYGDRVFTIGVGNRYNEFNGTSAASPHVAGAIALAYSVPCNKLATLSKNDPKNAALLLKHHLLSTTRSNESLNGITTSGGVLDIGNFVKSVNQMCETCFLSDPYIDESKNKDGSFQLNFTLPSGKIDLRMKLKDSSSWIEYKNITSNIELKNIGLCNTYEYQTKQVCGDTVLSPYSYSRYIESFGCCDMPIFNFSNIGTNSLQINSSKQSITDGIQLEYKLLNSKTVFKTSFLDSLLVSGLLPCQAYEVKALATCLGGRTQSKPVLNNYFNTKCGGCTEVYCPVGQFDNNEEWISQVTLNGVTWPSGSAPSGYSAILGTKIPLVMRGLTYPINVLPSFRSTPFREHFAVFVDLNQNAVFEPSERLVKTVTRQQELKDTLRIPISAKLGTTRMRVIMSFESLEKACDAQEEFGEVEDFCIEIDEKTSTNEIGELSKISLRETIFNESLELRTDLATTKNSKVTIYDLNGKLVHAEYLTLDAGTNRYTIHPVNDVPSQLYLFQIVVDGLGIQQFKIMKIK